MKRIKMVLYGEPGVGKSVFASKAPKPFFICTDGNYEWLEEFGADPKAHINVSSWSEIKKLIEDQKAFENYETIVLDLTEDGFKWCESEFCVRNKIDHISDLGYGKGYDTTRNEFFLTICKLIALEKHVILIMHGLSTTEKDRRGVEHTKYVPSSRIPDKVLDMIEGRVRYFLRAYIKDVEQSDGTVKKTRYLSLVPKPNEFGIIRGIDETKIPQDIPLEWNEFINAIGWREDIPETNVDVSPVKKTRTKKVVEEMPEQKTTVEILTMSETKEESKEEPKEESKEEPKKELTNEDKIAAIKAKLAALSKK